MIDIDRASKKKEWDDYAARQQGSSFSHLYDWGEKIAETYDLQFFRLAARARQTSLICGTLPLILFNPPGKLRRLISLPYTDSAGIIAATSESFSHLMLASFELADELRADHLELRQAGDCPDLQMLENHAGKWHHTAHDFKTGILRPLSTSTDAQWRDLTAKVRNQVRKARRCGCLAKIGGSELLPDFYAVFAENMRDLGSPVHAPELFQSLVDNSNILNGIVVVYLEEQAVAASLVLFHRKTLFNPWASSLRRFRPSCPNMLLYWSMLKYGINKGCKWFDFGRSSPDASTCRFKRQWGGRLEPLNWHVFSRKPQGWDPRRESLEITDWKNVDLDFSMREGPAIRRWISL